MIRSNSRGNNSAKICSPDCQDFRGFPWISSNCLEFHWTSSDFQWISNGFPEIPLDVLGFRVDFQRISSRFPEDFLGFSEDFLGFPVDFQRISFVDHFFFPRLTLTT